MDDIFYLSPSRLDVDCICAVFQNVPGIYIEGFTSSNAMQLYTKTQMLHFALMDIYEIEDPLSKKFIQDREIASIICISHHKLYIKETLELLKLMLEKWGGWVGNDNEGFIPIFDLTDVTSFSYE